jgi:hydrogenase nickel incorporation protein HypA/HybF
VHELALAEAIVAIAEEHAAGRRVETVEVKIGRLRQVVPSALTFAFELVTEGTPLKGARLEIEDVPVQLMCRTCTAESRVNDFPLACPECGGVDVEVSSGDELVVDTLELVDSMERI